MGSRDGDDAELHREEWWARIALQDRQRALSVAGIQPARAIQPLAAFTDRERQTIWLALAAHVSRMEIIQQCMRAHNTTREGYLH